MHEKISLLSADECSPLAVVCAARLKQDVIKFEFACEAIDMIVER